MWKHLTCTKKYHFFCWESINELQVKQEFPTELQTPQNVGYNYPQNKKLALFGIQHCLRPYHAENTSSRPITEVKQHWAALVLGWVTAWEYAVS